LLRHALVSDVLEHEAKPDATKKSDIANGNIFDYAGIMGFKIVEKLKSTGQLDEGMLSEIKENFKRRLSRADDDASLDKAMQSLTEAIKLKAKMKPKDKIKGSAFDKAYTQFQNDLDDMLFK